MTNKEKADILSRAWMVLISDTSGLTKKYEHTAFHLLHIEKYFRRLAAINDEKTQDQGGIK